VVVPKNVLRNWEQEYSDWGVAGHDCSVRVLDMSEQAGPTRLQRRAAEVLAWHRGPPSAAGVDRCACLQ
jgi:hypothetical protein